MPSPFSLPVHALRLAGRCLLPLVLWYSAAQAARWALLYGATEISHGDWRQVRLIVSIAMLTLVVLISMTMITGMFLSLRRVSWEGRARLAAGQSPEPFWRSLNRIGPAFAVIYLAWELHLQDARDYQQVELFHNVDSDFYKTIFNNIANNTSNETTYGRGLVDLDWRWSLAAMVVTFGLRVLFGRMAEQGSGRLSGVAAAFAEFSFVFCGLNALFNFTSARLDWAEHRAVSESTTQLWDHAKETVPGWDAFWTWLGATKPYILDALAVPLTWLAIAVLVFGAAAVDDTRRAVRGAGRLERGVERLEDSHQVTQKAMERVVGGFQERWVPVVNAFRITLRAGATLFGLMCLIYVGLHVGFDYLDRVIRTVIGSYQPYFWYVLDWPLVFLKDMIVTILSFATLAATFDIAATRARLRGEDITA
ncbi:hypothetical protein [Nonomuraea rhizosphaerae]|uniref:hypothetical protein n=1 Tax=Nonomuraea rhizosphaerae TaxID=2665663 RepID=UPI001C5D35DA|nr:hypothetical protein [Nonomuraea rhizosphaerae]